MKPRVTGQDIPRRRFPVDPWRLIETEPDDTDLGLTETLFAVGNGHVGMRANHSESHRAHTPGTYVNGFHETWPIVYPETAHGFATTGQTLVSVPDANIMHVSVGGEPLCLAEADLEHYERILDFSDGRLHSDVIWRSPIGDRVRVRSSRMVSLVHRDLAVLTLEITLLDRSARIGVSSQLRNRQDASDVASDRTTVPVEGADPRRSRQFNRRVLLPEVQRQVPDVGSGGEVTLGYRCQGSGMTVACAYRHEIVGEGPMTVETVVDDDLATTEFTITAAAGSTIQITKFVTYHVSRRVTADELADRCASTLAEASSLGVIHVEQQQRRWLDEFWAHSDVVINGDEPAQQAVRWNLFQLAQATARIDNQGVAAKAVTSDGYEGHYFWDTEIYVLPFLAYTDPDAASQLLRFRYHMLDAALARAAELSQRGALYPWRTINGEEASAYYPAGTAQYHINAAVVYAIETYVNASGDLDFLAHSGARVLVETARLWEDLGSYRYHGDGDETFHIHAVTGPDEYTAVVNDNTYTNLMAQFNLRYAARTVGWLSESDTVAYEQLRTVTGLGDDEVDSWSRAADAMFVPYDEPLGINPQDADFLDLEPWDFKAMPSDSYPLLAHYHPLVIYRHQVLKQADVVMAMFLRRQHLPSELKRRNFDYYDPITTGDSSLSACVQSIVAAEVGHHELARTYFDQSLYLDLANTHGNTSDGIHIANAGGVWAGLIYGFAGMIDDGERLNFRPRLPSGWKSMRFRLLHHGTSVEVTVDQQGCDVRWVAGPSLPVETPHGVVLVAGDGVLRVGSDR